MLPCGAENKSPVMYTSFDAFEASEGTGDGADDGMRRGQGGGREEEVPLPYPEQGLPFRAFKHASTV